MTRGVPRIVIYYYTTKQAAFALTHYTLVLSLVGEMQAMSFSPSVHSAHNFLPCKQLNIFLHFSEGFFKYHFQLMHYMLLVKERV